MLGTNNMKCCSIIITLLITATSINCSALENYVVKNDKVFSDGREIMTACFASEKFHLYNQMVTLKIFDRNVKTFPGNNSQIIRVLNESGDVIISQEIGGEPQLIEARIVPYFQSVLIYILCENRRSIAKSEYIYTITKDLKIEPSNIYISKDEAKRENEIMNKALKSMQEKIKK